MISTKPPGGTRDFLPDDLRRREYVIGVIRRVYERYGFEPLETPAFENIETLLGKYGEEGNKLIFKILRRGEHESTGEADLALRYDLTVPLARVVAQYQASVPRFFKRYQIQPVWRADRPARGRFREFYQCDVDALGSTSPIVEAEVLSAAVDALRELGFDDFTIRLNHRGVLSSLLTSAGIPPPRHGDALVEIDKLDKIGWDGVAKGLASKGFDEAICGRLSSSFGGHDRAPLEKLEGSLDSGDESGRAAVGNLRAICDLASETSAGRYLRFDPTLARGLSYYTGAIMEVAVPDLPGSLGGGGRYDNLIGMFLGRDIPACGFSLGLERIILIMTERATFPAAVAGSAVDVMLAFMHDGLRGDALKLAADWRRDGLRVEIFPDGGRKLDKPLKYASGRQVPFVAILGDDEREADAVSLKNMDTGEQSMMKRADAAQAVRARRPA